MPTVSAWSTTRPTGTLRVVPAAGAAGGLAVAVIVNGSGVVTLPAGVALRPNDKVMVVEDWLPGTGLGRKLAVTPGGKLVELGDSGGVWILDPATGATVKAWPIATCAP